MRLRPARLVLNAALMIVALGWLAPLALAVYASLRPYEETSRKGYFSWPDKLTLHYYAQVWDSAELPKYFTNSLIVAVPGVILTLFLASFVAFCIARLRIRFSLPLLVVFTAGNLLPPQVLVTPLYEMYKQIPVPAFVSESGTLYDSYAGLILIHVAFQVGFCVFVLSNFMRTLPTEITEAAVMDGAGVWLQYWKVTLPLCRPALAALATLLFTWIYNDFLYALVLISTGDKLPVTSALNNLRGQFFTDYNLLAAGSLLVALPTLIVFFALQRQFVAGLTLGAAKG
ncbi:carbohydrate ABC transporter permease [Dactylosporangium sp. CS-033363]|uniref:carbohydrate ABC transporter permease n=1 Tax=Dactylosporangium sp. CS-033363 TaxID=3239935 RepID=UPI003D914AB0